MLNDFQDRFYVILGFFVVIAVIFGFKLVQIQLIDTTYSDRATRTARQKLAVYPSRGLIYDRNGELIVNNEALYDLMVTYNQIDPAMDTLKFCRLLGIDRETFERNLDKDFSGYLFKPYKPFAFLNKISAETYTRFQESMYEFPGFFTQLRNVRSYPYAAGAHVLGYLNEVNRAQIENSNGKYALGDYIGATGLEHTYEEQLRGEKGARYVVRDNRGRIVTAYKRGSLDTVPKSGYDLVTTLDIVLQQYAEKLMQNKRGAVVAIEPTTGEILAMVSSPGYDPNLLSINRNRGQVFSQLLTDTLKPFFDRSVQAQYPPGSIFKTMISLVGMEEGVWSENRGVTCNGGYYYGGRRLGCHGHTYAKDVTTALQHSCNAYYCTAFREIVEKEGYYNPDQGLALLNRHLNDFGIGRKLGTDIPDEKRGNIPSPAYFDRIYPKELGGWKATTIISMGIGQGEVQMTTLQMANLAAAIANKGWYITPHLAKAFDRNGEVITIDTFAMHRTRIDTSYFAPTIEGMRRAVTAGTARRAEVPGLDICGKTGTSQNPHGKDHSVFFALAPQQSPKIAIAVFVENAGFGGTYAAPIASLVIEKYLNGFIAPERDYKEKRILEANLLSEQ